MGCRKFLHVLLLVVLLGLTLVTVAIAQQVPLNPNKIPNLWIPATAECTGRRPIETVDKRGNTSQTPIFMREFKVNVLPASTKLPNNVQYAARGLGIQNDQCFPAQTATYIAGVRRRT